MIVIVDYGLGNISNVKRAIEHLGYEVVVSNTSKIIDQAETIILPGVGPVSYTHLTLPTIYSV